MSLDLAEAKPNLLGGFGEFIALLLATVENLSPLDLAEEKRERQRIRTLS